METPEGEEPDDREDGCALPRTYKAGNVGSDGGYVVGRNRPPKHGKFAVGDGRKRGRRTKGTRNFDTEFEEEGRRLITLRENGRERRVTKLRSAIVRAFDNAGAKGQNQAIAAIFHHGARISERVAPPSQDLTADEDAMVNAWLDQRLESLQAGDGPGDPEDPSGPRTEPRLPKEGRADRDE